MALKKQFTDSTTRYHYALIARIEFAKNPENLVENESNLQVKIMVRDDENPEVNELYAVMNFKLPHQRSTSKTRTVEEIKTDGNGAIVLDKDGNPEMVLVELGPEMAPDTEYKDPLDLEEMRKEGADISALGYKWLLETQDFFKDWQSC